MKETAIYKFPYAEDSDAPDYPTQGKELADRLEVVLDLNLTAPTCRAIRTTDLTVGSATEVPITWNGESWDTATMHSTAENTERLVAPKKGLYRLDTILVWKAEPKAGSRRLTVFKNSKSGTAPVAQTMHPFASTEENLVQADSFSIPLEANDYLVLSAWTSTAATSLLAAVAPAIPATQATLTWTRPYPA